MRHTVRRVCGILAGAAAITGIGGCVVAGDLLNPGFLTGLGIDSSTVIPPQGRIVVSFQNESAAEVELNFTFSRQTNASNLAALDFDELATTPIAQGEISNLTVDCPVGLLRPGDFLTGANAVTAAGGGDAAAGAINYTGAILRSGVDFRCGDVIVVRLSATNELSVEIQAGR